MLQVMIMLKFQDLPIPFCILKKGSCLPIWGTYILAASLTEFLLMKYWALEVGWTVDLVK